MTSRRYSFTCWNPELYDLVDEETLPESIRYLIWQVERCPTSGKTHLQGYLELTKPARFAAIKKMFTIDDEPADMHISQSLGSKEQNIAYCTKPNESFPDADPPIMPPKEFGDSTVSQGSRSDLLAVASAIADGKSIKEIAEEHPLQFIKFHNGIGKLHSKIHEVKRNWKTIVFVLYGPTGTGKTSAVFKEFPDVWCLPSIPANGHPWLDGYYGQEVVLIDDITDEEGKPKIVYPEFLKLTDRFPHTGPVKGGFIEWAPKVLFITSNYPPNQWYSWKGEGSSPHLRRIDHIINFPTIDERVCLKTDPASVSMLNVVTTSETFQLEEFLSDVTSNEVVG